MAMPPGSVAERPEIVVAICTYNNAPLLDRALASLAAQEPPGVSWRVLVVDNNCTDETAEVVRRHQARGAPPALDLVSEPRQGLAHARRRAIASSDAPLIAFVDDDCVLSPGWVAEASRFARDHPRAGVVGGRVALRWEDSPAPWLLDFAGSFAHQDHGDEPVRFPDRGVVRLVGAGFVCRREALADSGWLAGGALVGREGTALSAGEDIELVLRIREAGWEAWYAPGLRLEHFIPRRRMQEQYVRRMHRGFGRARVPLHFIETRQAATSSRLLRAVVYALRELATTGAAALVARGERERVRSRVAWDEAMGKLEGAWTMLRNGHRA